MEYRIEDLDTPVDLDAVEAAIRRVDPAAVVDWEPCGQALRVAATADEFELVVSLAQVGRKIDLHQIRRLPSVCCGGCGG